MSRYNTALVWSSTSPILFPFIVCALLLGDSLQLVGELIVPFSSDIFVCSWSCYSDSILNARFNCI